MIRLKLRRSSLSVRNDTLRKKEEGMMWGLCSGGQSPSSRPTRLLVLPSPSLASSLFSLRTRKTERHSWPSVLSLFARTFAWIPLLSLDAPRAGRIKALLIRSTSPHAWVCYSLPEASDVMYLNHGSALSAVVLLLSCHYLPRNLLSVSPSLLL